MICVGVGVSGWVEPSFVVQEAVADAIVLDLMKGDLDSATEEE